MSLAVAAGITLSGCNDVLFDNVNPDRAHSNTVELGLAPVVFFANQSVYAKPRPATALISSAGVTSSTCSVTPSGVVTTTISA